MINKLVKMLAVTFLIMTIAYGIGDSRISYSVPYNQADPSLKTTDPFYGGNARDVSGNAYQLAPVFLGDIYKREENKNVLTLHRSIDNDSNLIISNATAYDLTEGEMKKANITNGQESWL